MDNMNYTKPDDPGHVDKPEDWLAGALVFARTLSLIIPEKEAILVEPKGTALEYFGTNSGLIAVANLENQIKVFYLNDHVEDSSEYREGDWIVLEE